MLAATVIHSPILEPTRHQKNHKIQPQSCLVHFTSPLLIGRCFTSVKIPVYQQPCHQTLFPWHVIQLIGRCFTSVKIPVYQQPCHQTLFPWHVIQLIGRCFTSVKIPVYQQPCHQTLFPWHVIQLAINPIGVYSVKLEKLSYSFSATYLLS